MNVLILSTHFNTGGITSYILTLAKGLAESGHRVYVATSGGNMVEELVAAGIEHLQCEIKTKSELNPKIYLALPKISRFIKEKNIDVLHAHTRVTQVMGAALSRMTGKPYVATCHGFYKERLSRKLFPCWGIQTIAISEAVRDYLMKDYKLSGSRTHLIHVGMDFSLYLPADDETRIQRRKKYNFSREPLIGIIARLSEEKGHRVLIEAMRQVIKEVFNAHLFVVGQGKTEAALKQLTGQLGLESHVHFYPTVNQTPEILSILDVFILPSLAEGFGLSILEAQAAGLPVVASRVGGIPDLIKDGETGVLVSPGDAGELARAIIKLLQNREKAAELGRSARLFIEENFSVNQFVRKTSEVYKMAAKK